MFETDDETDINAPTLRISLRIRGDTLDPDFITQHLGVTPTFTARKGEALTGIRAGETRLQGVWVYNLPETSEVELGDLIEILLARFPTDSNLWDELTAVYSADVFCGVFLRGDNQSTEVSSETAARLGRLGLPLLFDFYAPFGGSNES